MMRSQRREVSKEEKISTLRKEFDAIDVNHDDLLTFDELNNYLDHLVDKEFDRNVSLQLYERMDKNYDGKITRDEFIKTFLEAEEILLFKVENSRKYIEDYKLQRQNALQRLDEIKRTEVLNSYGIMEESVVNITVIEGHNLGYGDMVVYCTLMCGRENYQTNTSSSGNPTWNETFSFNIETGRETIEIDVLDYSSSSQSLIGKINIQVNAFRDQLKHDEWFDLERNQGGRLHLNVQWIHSKVKFLSDVVDKWNDHIKIQEEDLFDYEKDLEVIYEPFKGLQGLFRGSNIKKSVERYEPPHLHYDIPAPQVRPEPENKRVVLVENNQNLDFQRIQKLCVDKLASLVMITILIFAFFVCFNRAAFVDILIPTAFISLHHMNMLDARICQILVGALSLSIIIDIPWLAIYHSNWWNAGMEETIIESDIALLTESLLSSANNSTLYADTLDKISSLETQLANVYDTTVTVYLYRFVIVMSYFLLVSKVIGAIIIFSESRKFSEPSKTNPNHMNKSEIKGSNIMEHSFK